VVSRFGARDWGEVVNELPAGSRLLYKVLSGSHATNLVTPDSDEDWRGVYQVPTRQILGLQQPPETVEVPPDTTYWELAHFARLCLRGNPNIMELLWVCPDPVGTPHPCSMVEQTSNVMDEIRTIRESFLTTSMIRSYLGWVTKERRILGGYAHMIDPQSASATKRASHLVRLLLGLQVALTEHRLPVYLEGEDRDLCMSLKLGEQSLIQALFTVDILVAKCKALAEQANWPEPDPKPIEDIVIRARIEML